MADAPHSVDFEGQASASNAAISQAAVPSPSMAGASQSVDFGNQVAASGQPPRLHEIYGRLDITLEERGVSFYYSMIPPPVDAKPFHMIFEAAEQAGRPREGVTRLDHMGFGVVQGEDNNMFNERSGDADHARQRSHAT